VKKVTGLLLGSSFPLGRICNCDLLGAGVGFLDSLEGWPVVCKELGKDKSVECLSVALVELSSVNSRFEFCDKTLFHCLINVCGDFGVV
jgi:hypothetical protein